MKESLYAVTGKDRETGRQQVILGTKPTLPDARDLADSLAIAQPTETFQVWQAVEQTTLRRERETYRRRKPSEEERPEQQRPETEQPQELGQNAQKGETE